MQGLENDDNDNDNDRLTNSDGGYSIMIRLPYTYNLIIIFAYLRDIRIKESFGRSNCLS